MESDNSDADVESDADEQPPKVKRRSSRLEASPGGSQSARIPSRRKGAEETGGTELAGPRRRSRKPAKSYVQVRQLGASACGATLDGRYCLSVRLVLKRATCSRVACHLELDDWGPAFLERADGSPKHSP